MSAGLRFNQEIDQRTAYVERSVELMKAVVQTPEAEDALGDLATRIVAQDFYVPRVTELGMVEIPDEHKSGDALPLLPIRDGELLWRNRKDFSTFTPSQQEVAREYYAERSLPAPRANRALREATQRVGESIADIPPIRLNGVTAIASRLMYPVRISGTKRSFIGMRPLITMLYEDGARAITPELLVREYCMAQKIIQNTIMPPCTDQEHDAMYNAWCEETKKIQGVVGRIFKSS